jgi:hypothetical protein
MRTFALLALVAAASAEFDDSDKPFIPSGATSCYRTPNNGAVRETIPVNKDGIVGTLEGFKSGTNEDEIFIMMQGGNKPVTDTDFVAMELVKKGYSTFQMPWFTSYPGFDAAVIANIPDSAGGPYEFGFGPYFTSRLLGIDLAKYTLVPAVEYLKAQGYKKVYCYGQQLSNRFCRATQMEYEIFDAVVLASAAMAPMTIWPPEFTEYEDMAKNTSEFEPRRAWGYRMSNYAPLGVQAHPLIWGWQDSCISDTPSLGFGPSVSFPVLAAVGGVAVDYANAGCSKPMLCMGGIFDMVGLPGYNCDAAYYKCPEHVTSVNVTSGHAAFAEIPALVAETAQAYLHAQFPGTAPAEPAAEADEIPVYGTVIIVVLAVLNGFLLVATVVMFLKKPAK